MTSRRGFTVTELLVAMTILILMVVLMANIVSHVSSAWMRSRAKMDNFAKGRALVDHFDQELRRAIRNGSLATFPLNATGGSVFAFYTQSLVATNQSDLSNARPLTYVSYELDSNGVLKRHDEPYSFQGSAPAWIGPADTNTIPAAGPVTYDLCEGVYGFDYAFVDKTGRAFDSFNRTSTNRESTKSVQVSLFIVSEQAEKTMTANPTYEQRVKDIAAIDPLPSGGTVGWSPKKEWDSRLDDPSRIQGLPTAILTGIRTYERVIPFEFTSVTEVAP